MRKTIFFLSILLMILYLPFLALSGEAWYEGGNLHRAPVSQWNNSSYANKLATAADMALMSPSIESKVRSSGSMNTLRPYA